MGARSYGEKGAMLKAILKDPAQAAMAKRQLGVASLNSTHQYQEKEKTPWRKKSYALTMKLKKNASRRRPPSKPEGIIFR